MGKKRKKWNVGVGAGEASFSDWLNSETDKIGQSWGKGGWGIPQAAGQAALLPFDALSKGVGYAVGGPVQGTLARLSGDESADPTDWQQSQERYETLNPFLRFGIETGVSLLAPGGLLGKGVSLGSKLVGWEKAGEAARAARGLIPLQQPGVRSAANKAGSMLDMAEHVPGPAGRLEAFRESDRVQDVAKKIDKYALKTTLPGLTAVGTTIQDIQEGKDPLQSAVEGAFVGLGVLGIGQGLKGLAGFGKVKRPTELLTEADGTTPGSQDLIRNLTRAQMREKGYAPDPNNPEGLLHPAHKRGLGKAMFWTNQHGVDKFLTRWIDKTAPFRTWQKDVQMSKARRAAADTAEREVRASGGDWNAMTDDEKWEHTLKAWDSLDDAKKLEATKLEPWQNAVAKMIEFAGSAKRIENYMRQVGVDLRASGIDVSNPAHTDLLDQWMTIRQTESRIKNGYNTSGLSARYEPIHPGSPITERDESLRVVAEAKADIERKINATLGTINGKNATEAFDSALLQMNAHFDAQLDRMIASDIITPEEAQRMRDAVGPDGFYAKALDTEFDVSPFENLGKSDWFEQSKMPTSLVSATKGVGQTRDSMGNEYFTSLVSTMEHFAWRERLIQKNEVGKALAGWIDQDPNWATVMRKVGPGAQATKGHGIIPVATKGERDVLDQFGQPVLDPVTHVVKREPYTMVENYEVPEDLFDALKGLNTESADVATRFMGKLSEGFRLGVTAFSIPFMMRNVTRDLETVFLQNGFTSLTAKSYMAAMLDTLTNGRLEPLAKRLGAKFDPTGRLEQAMMSPTKWTHKALLPDGTDPNANMTWLEEMMTHGGGMGTLAEVMGNSRSVAKMLGLEKSGGIAMLNPIEAIRAGSEILELTTRVGVYRTARLKGIKAMDDEIASMQAAGRSADEIEEFRHATSEAEIQKAVGLAREATVDFSRSGNVTRIINQWLPLLNARVQGTYRTMNAAGEDPYGFFVRGMLTIGLPTIATYQHNRENFGDLYDKITPEAKDSYYPIIIGSYDDRNGDVRPVYLAIPKDPAHKMISTPIEYLLDTLTHTEAYGQEIEGNPLSPGMRTERPLEKVIWDELMQLSPVNVNVTDLSDPRNFLAGVGKSLLSGNPVLGTMAQLGANQDWQRGNIPIEDEYSAYLRDDEDEAVVQGTTVKMLADAMGLTPFFKPAPAQVAFMSKTLGGTAAQTFIGASDLLLEKLGMGAPKPTDWSRLAIPPGTDKYRYEQLIEAMSKIDTRPWWVKQFPMFFGTAGGQQTQAAKVAQLPPEAQKRYWDTRNLWDDYEKWMMDEWHPTMTSIQSKLADDPEMTHGSAMNQIFSTGKLRGGVMEGLKRDYMMAITDPKERKAFHESMPGVPVRFADQTKRLQEIEGTILAEAIRRYDSPSRIAARPDLQNDPVVMNSARNAELNDMAREYGVDSKDLQDQILAYKRGTTLPTIAIPAVYIEEAVARYKYPKGVADLGDLTNDDLIVQRAAEIRTMAAEWGISEEDLWTRVRARLSFPEEKSEMMTSFEKALNLSTQVRNFELFPDYMDKNGNPMGTKADWLAWESAIQEAKGRFGTDYQKWPKVIRDLDDAKRTAELHRLQFLMQQDDYVEYQKWFGVGKNLNGEEWNKFISGEYQRYKRGTPEQWNLWDQQIKLYEAAPRGGALRRQLAPQVEKINKMMNKGWRAALFDDRASYERAREEGTFITERSNRIKAEYPDELFGFDPTNPEPWRAAKAAGVGSPLELQFLQAFESEGIRPAKQYEIKDEAGRTWTTPDFALPERRVAIYIDGKAVHDQTPVAAKDKELRDRLREAGWTVLEYRSGDLKRGTKALVGDIVGNQGSGGWKLPWL